MPKSDIISIDQDKTLKGFNLTKNPAALEAPIQEKPKIKRGRPPKKISDGLLMKSLKSEIKKTDIKEDNMSVKKEDMIRIILKYQSSDRFGASLKKDLGIKYTRPQLVKYTEAEVEAALHRIRTHLNTRNMDKVFNHMAEQTAMGYENLITGFGYNITGFKDILWANPSFHDAFCRWKIEQKVPDVPPSFQMMYIVASTTYIAHLHNSYKMKPSIDKKPKDKKEKDIVIEDSDDKKEPTTSKILKPGDFF